MVNRWGNNVNSDRLYFLLQNHWGWWLQPQNWKTLAPWKERYDKFWQHIKKQRQHFADKEPHSQSYGFSSSHVWMWELDCKTLKDWCFQIVMLEKTLEILLDYKEIKSVNSKGNQPWIFTGRTDGAAESPKLWPLNARADSLEKTLMMRKTEGRRRRERQRMRWLDGITDSTDMSLSIL